MRRPLKALIAGAGLALMLGSAALAQTPCTTATGASGQTLIFARVLTPEAVLENTQVLVDADGIIACVGDACAAQAPSATVLQCPYAVLSPGFINSHEHLDFNHIAPTPDDGVRYGHRHDWRKGLRGLPGKENFTLDRNPDLLAWSELRHLLTGTTSIMGTAFAPGLVRNLDVQEGLEGLTIPRATYAIFPLDDAPGTLRRGDCDYGPRPANRAQVSALHAYVPHFAEGRDDEARNEFNCLADAAFDTRPREDGSGVSADILLPNVALIHGVGLTPAMLKTVAERGAGLIWSPRSNLYLYGVTADIAAAKAAGVTLALGTDWLPSGSISMPREAQCALDYSRDHLGGLIGPKDLWRMMTVDAARVVSAEAALGAIRPGLAADLILVQPRYRDPFEAVVRAEPEDLLMVMRGGKILAGTPLLVPDAPGCEIADINGQARRLCIQTGSGKSYAALEKITADRKIWPAVFSGAPPVEPPCMMKP
jgi:hypothetical protein